MEITNELKNKVKELYINTPENVHGVSIGYKYVNNVKTDQIGIVFTVFNKKNVSELPPEDILPTGVIVENQIYITDVMQEPTLPSGLACFDNTNGDYPDIIKLRGIPEILNPIKGGQEILQFPTKWISVDGTTSASVGTLGFIAVDNIDNKLVGITNAHVSCYNPYIASDRVESVEINAPYNTKEEIEWIGSPGTNYSAGHLSYDGGAGTYFISSKRIKRYSPYYKSPSSNYIDAAILFLNNSYIGSSSYQIHQPTSEAEYSAYMPFASTQELDSLLSVSHHLYSTGRTTGPKGWGDSASCRLMTTSVAVSQSVTFDGETIPFDDIVSFSYEDGGQYPVAGGDSGSVVIADFSGVRKIVGLVFAGSTYTAYFCRIDRVATALNIRAWDANYILGSNPCGNPYIAGEATIPANASQENIIVCDFNDARSSQPTVTHSGVVYYQAGCTTQNGYPQLP